MNQWRISTVCSFLCLAGLLGCRPNIEKTEAEVPAVESQPTTSEIRILAWNVESGGSEAETIATQLSEFNTYDLYALSEVSPRHFKIFSSAVGDNFTSLESRSGASDRLQIIFDKSRFELLELDEPQEIEGIKVNDGNHRSPLIVHLKDRRTGEEMLLTVVHLARRNEELREQQALGLTEWARGKSIPMVANGDFNFDYSFVTHEGNQSCAAMFGSGLSRRNGSIRIGLVILKAKTVIRIRCLTSLLWLGRRENGSLSAT